jgi:hypothetical protein
MNILLLSNNAPNYQHFFGHLAKRLHGDGHRIVVAVDSNFSRSVNKLDALDFPIEIFSDHFAAHETNFELLARYADFNLNSALLSDFERAEVYGIWKSIDATYLERLKSALLDFFERIVIQHSINAIVYENVSNAFAYYAYIVSQRHGIGYCGIGSSRLPGRFSITADPLRDSAPRKLFAAIQSGSYEIDDLTRSWCEQYLKNLEETTPDYMRSNGLSDINLVTRYLRKDRLETIGTLLRHSLMDGRHAFQIGNPVLHYLNLFKRNVARNFRARWLKTYYEPVVKGEKYLLYPLHFHPESSTSVLAGTYLNEYEVIRNIAFNLPSGITLYVKDHLSAYGYPSKDFYRRLKKLPNVRVLAPQEQAKTLVRNSAGVITLTSTMGYEALLMGKTVFLYGSVFYEHHKNVIKVGDPANLFELIKKNIDKQGADISYNINFLAAYYLATKPGALNLMLKPPASAKMADDVYPEVLSYLKAVVEDGDPKVSAQNTFSHLAR